MPAYSFAEAAVLAGVPLPTLRSWVVGERFPALIRLPHDERRYLSFTNLVEVHVLAAMRRRRALSLAALRLALRSVHEALSVDHPLATKQFKTNGVDLFVERLGNVKAVLLSSLDRIEYDEHGRAMRLFPLFRRGDAPKSIVVDPRLAFGRPVIAGTAVPAADIRSRFDAGDGVAALARDFEVRPELVEDALRAARFLRS